MATAKSAEGGHPAVGYKEARETEMKIFSRRLWRLMTSKGWNQSELARRTKDADPAGVGLGRDMISGYIRGLHLPDPPNAKKLADAFGISVEELFPSAGEPVDIRRELPPIELRSTTDGKAMLHVNLELPFDTAVQVLALVQEHRQKSGA